MNWNIVEGNWKQFKGTIGKRWGKLTDDHLDSIAGSREHLLGTLQQVYGVDRTDAESEIIAFEVQHETHRIQ